MLCTRNIVLLLTLWVAVNQLGRKLKDGRVVLSIPNLRHIGNVVYIVKVQNFEYGL